MKLAAVALMLIVTARSAEAGPWCGGFDWFAPAKETVLPVSPLIAQNIDDTYYGGDRDHKNKPQAFIATIDGKRVTYKTQDVRTKEGVIRLIRITSKKTGTLELRTVEPAFDEKHYLLASYTISKDAPAIEAPSISISHGQDTRISVYNRIGELAVLRTDAPAVMFTLRWRRDADDEWRVRPLEAWIDYEIQKSEAHVGGSMCGMVENVPVAFLEKGVEAELTAKLVDGRDVAIELPKPFVMPPREPGQLTVEERRAKRKAQQEAAKAATAQ
jgi:hypothetical protein